VFESRRLQLPDCKEQEYQEAGRADRPHEVKLPASKQNKNPGNAARELDSKGRS
jgi:hypothetical protein